MDIEHGEPIDEAGDDADRRGRAVDFSRRALLHAGWAVPVVLSLRPTAAFAQSAPPHTDAPHDDHDDAVHDDAVHTDTHSDTPHGDGGHNDAPHIDMAHSDTVHGDVAHNDTSLAHVDLDDFPILGHLDLTVPIDHEDIAHVDEFGHSDTAHADHNDIIQVDLFPPNGILVNAIGHDDEHGDGPGASPHGDSAHGDVPHADS